MKIRNFKKKNPDFSSSSLSIDFIFFVIADCQLGRNDKKQNNWYWEEEIHKINIYQ